MPVEEPNRHFPNGNPNFEYDTLITIQGACESGMEKETNEDINFLVNFDKLSEKHGLVLTKEIVNQTEIDLSSCKSITKWESKENVYSNHQR